MELDFIEELEWRGMLHQAIPETQVHCREKMRQAYIGFDPTSDSLHIGNLVGIMLLKHFQLAGHQPIALVGGATGLIGDPSGKSKERQLLDENTLRRNQDAIKEQLSRFLDFDTSKSNHAILVNNYDWMKDISFIGFIRDIGKHITVNYMMAKDSVKNRLSLETSEGMSFTEFTYQLIQAYDFLHLNRKYNCSLQMGGSDQWGNITTGTELLRRIDQTKGYALTSPLVTKADGQKFGKSEQGNIWLDANKTTPYAFYQYWINTIDEDAARFIKLFTLLDETTINALVNEHAETPGQRKLQQRLAEEVTLMVHGSDELQKAQKASQVLYGKSTFDDLNALDEKTFLSVFEGVPQAKIDKTALPLSIVDALADQSQFLASKGEARRALKENSVAVNKEKVGLDFQISADNLINDQYVLINRGKKKTFLLMVE
ncbi:MAG: tyrosine--tRNA ligase [Psychroflexus sp.]|nr:tyrosine--tRNA ligase [Psychroflexus sp.]